MSQFAQLATENQIKSAVKHLEENGFAVHVVDTKEEALQVVTRAIPEKAEVMTGSSTTLNEIGFATALEENKKNWVNWGAKVWSENDDTKRSHLRRQALLAEYFLSSVNAITEDGKLVAVDASGSRVGALPFAAEKIIFVVGTNKITKDLDTAFQRVREYVFPQEDARAQEAYGIHSSMNKWVILEGDQPERTTVVLVKEALGF
ncbi:lactate utilization protein [Candidatus Woesebacteria bacterium]|nr:lactate utilization protein [Candidatus Woesebacteria bacterium]MCD8507745.1 lactate utilization protein [Candidatus Woesebacteria bacterium]MCD8526688.1 lactate utilization protein [Candidatus Woesebacteria bacterium]MCD8545897.1 lactate utilization protein [Candidatus Woesebacteria bacterium]